MGLSAVSAGHDTGHLLVQAGLGNILHRRGKPLLRTELLPAADVVVHSLLRSEDVGSLALKVAARAPQQALKVGVVLAAHAIK